MYNKTIWKTGDVVTADKLNHLENGVSNEGILYIHTTAIEQVDEDHATATIDKTFEELYEAYNNGKYLIVVLSGSELPCLVPMYGSLFINEGQGIFDFETTTPLKVFDGVARMNQISIGIDNMESTEPNVQITMVKANWETTTT